MDRKTRLARKNAFDGSLTYGTLAFNRQTGRDRHLVHQAAVAPLHVDPATGLLRADLQQRRPCPLCGKDEGRVLFVKGGFPHVRCAECEMIYVTPILTAEAQERYYVEESSWVDVLMSGPQRELDERKFAYGLDLLAPHGESGRRLVDVGCGPGLCLEVARAAGWDVHGVELNAAAVARLRALGIPVSDQPLERTDLPAASFDAATLWEVLEHIPDPRAFLATVRGVLRPGGILLVCVPNADALVTRLLHERSGTFRGQSHVNFFNVGTLGRLLEEGGFRVVDRDSIITELGTIHNYLNYEDPYFGGAPPAVPSLTPEFLHDHFLGSRILVVAVRGPEAP